MPNTKPQVKIVNAETGEEITRDANAEELAQIAKDQTEHNARIAKEETKANAKADLLARLGITADEARLLLS